MPLPLVARLTFLSALLTALTTSPRTQCAANWQPGVGVPGVYGAVHAAVMWDPDGAGPQPTRLVLGGNFSSAGNTPADNVVSWDPTTGAWEAIGFGLSSVTSLHVAPGNRLIANGTWQWNGVSWYHFGNQTATATAVFRNGDAVAAYQSNYWGGGQVGYVYFAAMERWNGSSWTPVASFWPHSSTVTRLFALDGGDFIASGTFPGNFARFNGNGWRSFGSGLNDVPVALLEHSDGSMFVGGDFTTAGGSNANRIAEWTGSSWSALGSGMDNTVLSFLELPEGDIIVGGSFTTAGGVPARGIARWDGSTWSALGAGIAGQVEALTLLPNGDLLAGGSFTRAGNTDAFGVARWNGTTWSALSTATAAMSDPVLALEEDHNGDLVAGGLGGSITRWDGAHWATMAETTLGLPWLGGVKALERLPNGDLIAAGSFTAIDTVTARGIARWDGTAWSPLGTGTNNTVAAVTALPNGDVIAAGGFSNAGGVIANSIARWDGAGWSALGAGISSPVHAVATMQNGDVVAGGFFTSAGGIAANGVARWNGSAWAPLGTGINGSVQALLPLPSGDLIVGGSFFAAGGAAASNIARWDGANWSPLGAGITGEVRSLAALPNGDIVAGGVFMHAGTTAVNSLARWDGASWSALDGGLDGAVHAVLWHGDETLAVGGGFGSAGAQASAYVATLATNCPAAATSIATTCVGPAGPITLAADTRPWTGTDLRTTATGFAANALAVALVGLTSPNIPLSVILPNALPGCRQLASAEAVAFRVPQAGISSHAFAIPNSPTLTGLQLFHQMLQFELNAQSQLVSASSSNGLMLTVGTF